MAICASSMVFPEPEGPQTTISIGLADSDTGQLAVQTNETLANATGDGLVGIVRRDGSQELADLGADGQIRFA